uniref:Uncharacterized protein n=1 Tax=Rhizophora mucronata TaxID=61149 RepID=A0A2P2MXI9_RHIMU
MLKFDFLNVEKLRKFLGLSTLRCA